MKGEGNQQDYGMRIYDPRLGRFLSVDPLTKGYPMLTPYQFASNSPVAGVDMDGGEFKYYGLVWATVNGKPKLKIGKLDEIVNDIKVQFNFIKSGPGGDENIPISVSIPRSLVGLSGTFVNYDGEAVRIPDKYINNLPSLDDPA